MSSKIIQNCKYTLDKHAEVELNELLTDMYKLLVLPVVSD